MAFAEVEGGFEGLEEAGVVGFGEGESVLENLDLGFETRDFRGWWFVGSVDVPVLEDAEVSLLVEEGEKFRGFGAGRNGDGKGDVDGLAGEIFNGPSGGGFGGVRLDDFAGVGIVPGGEAGVEEFQVIVDFRECANGGAGGADVVFLLDGDGGRDALDGINVRFVHAIKELPDVGRESLDVAALAFCIERVEGEGGLAGAGGAGDDGQFSQRDLQIKVLEIVLAAAAEADGRRVFCVRRHAGILNGKWHPAREVFTREAVFLKVGELLWHRWVPRFQA